MAGIRRLNHAVLYVTDAKKSAAFYCDVLGFSIVQDNAGGRATTRQQQSMAETLAAH